MTGVLLTIAGVFALGAVMILIASLFVGGRRTAQALWPFYRSEFLIVGCFLLPAATGSWVFLALLLLMSARGQFELFDLSGPLAPVHVLALLLGAGLVTIGALAPGQLALASILAIALLLASGLALEGRKPRALLAAASLIFPVLPLALMGVLRTEPQGFLWLFLAQATVESNDAFALVLGKLIGRTQPFPRLSPGKTLAGLVCGLLAGAVVGFVIAHDLLGLPLATTLAAVAAALMAGLAGDLLVSALKRRQNRKDFRPLALLHGGLLDIYDSLLFAAPALLLLRTAAGL